MLKAVMSCYHICTLKLYILYVCVYCKAIAYKDTLVEVLVCISLGILL